MLKFIKVSLLVLTLMGPHLGCVGRLFRRSRNTALCGVYRAAFAVGHGTLSAKLCPWAQRLLVAYSILFVAIWDWWLFWLLIHQMNGNANPMLLNGLCTFDGDTVTVHISATSITGGIGLSVCLLHQIL